MEQSSSNPPRPRLEKQDLIVVNLPIKAKKISEKTLKEIKKVKNFH